MIAHPSTPKVRNNRFIGTPIVLRRRQPAQAWALHLLEASMTLWRVLIVSALMPVIPSSAPAAEMLDRDHVLRALEARDASIQSSRLAINRAWVQSAVDPAQLVKDSEIELQSRSPQEVFDGIVKRLANGPPIRWLRSETLSRGRQFKTTMTPSIGDEIAQYCDGEHNVLWRRSANTTQVDIHPSTFDQFNRYDLDQLNLRLVHCYKSRKLVAFNADSGRYSLTFEHGDGNWSTVVDLASDLTILRFRSSLKGKLVEQAWYLAPRTVGSIPLPQIIVYHYPDNRMPALAVIHVENVWLNPDISDQELLAPDIPDGTTVVDHRTSPPTVKRSVNAERIRQLRMTRKPFLEDPVEPPPAAAPLRAAASESRPWPALILWGSIAVVLVALLLYAFRRLQPRQ